METHVHKTAWPLLAGMMLPSVTSTASTGFPVGDHHPVWGQ